MLAKKLDTIAHQHDRIQSGTAALRGECRMRRNAMEKELGGIHSKRAAVEYAILTTRMPLQNHIDFAK